MDTLYQLLKENVEIYKLLLEFQYDKYAATIKDDFVTLDQIVSQEEVYYLKMKGIEEKRKKVVNSLGLADKTLKEIIHLTEDKYKIPLQEQLEELEDTVKELKKIKGLLKIVIEYRLGKIDEAMGKLGENRKEGLLISEKI